MSVYELNGYKNRKDYLEQMALEYDIPFEDVLALASTLGKSEDFDGLVDELEDYVWHREIKRTWEGGDE